MPPRFHGNSFLNINSSLSLPYHRYLPWLGLFSLLQPLARGGRVQEGLCSHRRNSAGLFAHHSANVYLRQEGSNVDDSKEADGEILKIFFRKEEKPRCGKNQNKISFYNGVCDRRSGQPTFQPPIKGFSPLPPPFLGGLFGDVLSIQRQSTFLLTIYVHMHRPNSISLE